MERRLLDPGYRFRPPRPSRFWDRALRPVQRWVYRRMYRTAELEVRGEAHLHRAVEGGQGALVAINHPAHGDAFTIFEAMARLRVPCCYLAAWQVLQGWMGVKAWAFQRLGAFTIDREGTDMRSFRTAVDVLAQTERSLVIFPEGEVYHLSDRLTPLREGAAMIALSAARRRRSREGAPPLRVVPCALKYFYLEDLTPQLEALMGRLEERLFWRPAGDRPLGERIYRYAEAILALKEMEHLGSAGRGALPERIAALCGHILGEVERRRETRSAGEPVPVRVKRLRQEVLKTLGAGDDAAGPAAPGEAARRDLEDLHLVTQLFSYPGDYVARRPTLERIAETLDKFEEDALGAENVGPRAPRRAIVSFGPPIDVDEHVPQKGGARGAASALTGILEQRMQSQIDAISAG